MTCRNCGGRGGLSHHIRYDGEYTIDVCSACHAGIHNDPDHLFHPVDESPRQTVTVTPFVKRMLQAIMEEEEHKSFDSVIRCLALEHDEGQPLVGRFV